MQYGIASELTDDDGTLARLLALLDGTRELTEVWRDLDEPGWSRTDITDVVAALAEAGHIEDPGAPVPANLSAAEADRYSASRHFFAWIDPATRTSPYEVQSRIRDASVALLGLGGTGSTVAASLVASGIGALHCADFDRVEEGNLTRQLIYTEQDIGLPKVDRAVARLSALNSNVAVTGVEAKVSGADDIVDLIGGRDLFVLCADEPAELIQSWANQAAVRTGTPWFMALYTGPMTVVGSFIPGRTGCWECLDRGERARGARPEGRWLFDDRPNAVLAATAGVSGHLCALEVLFHLGGLPTQTRGRIFHHNVANWDHQYYIDAVPDPRCPTCATVSR
jgi:molybdopterin/thiamine biosynthesis adenylyltransferase